MRTMVVAALLGVALFAGCAGVDDTQGYSDDFRDLNGDDAVVIAVIDSGINPYHFDYRAAFMPQHLDGDATNDLPLHQDPAAWLPGHPGADVFASYGALHLNLSTDDTANGNDLRSGDDDAWSTMAVSSGEEDDGIHMRYIPGTKIIGLVSFSGSGFSAGSHGGGSASVSTGNFNGACPECLLVFVNGLGHEANEWVAKQDWIDAQTNSWGYSKTGVARDRIHNECDLTDQRTAVERGQSLFFSAGNGLANAFTVPNPTLFSCQEGPDWIITVGAISQTDGSSKHHGHPADIASVGGGYPSAYCSANINCTGSFGGTSNATPVTAGMYGKALYEVRKLMAGPSRVQSDGVISVGAAECVEAGCALEDGNVTVHELRTALYDASEWQAVGRSVNTGPTVPVMTDETVLAAEGHGSLWGRLKGDAQYQEEIDRMVGGITGQYQREYPVEALAWFTNLSYCTQGGWGAWEHGDYQPGGTVYVGPDRPVTAWMGTYCPDTIEAVRDNA